MVLDRKKGPSSRNFPWPERLSPCASAVRRDEPSLSRKGWVGWPERFAGNQFIRGNQRRGFSSALRTAPIVFQLRVVAGAPKSLSILPRQPMAFISRR